MNVIKQRLPGVIISQDESTALFLTDSESIDYIYLSYAFITLGVESHILPSVLLDDWGTEIRGQNLYRWVKSHGDRFPRAELFGKMPNGNPVQIFLRDLDLLALHPIYAFGTADDEIGQLVQAIIFQDAKSLTIAPAEPPSELSPPLGEGRVSWWRAASRPADLAFLSTR